MSGAICIHVASRGNRFMADLASLYATGLADRGWSARVAFDEVPTTTDELDLVLAPHEFFVVGPELTPEDRHQIVRRSVMLTTEQPGSPWFDTALPYAGDALATLDLAVAGVTALAQHGIEATWAPIGYHSSLDAFQGRWDQPRSIDATFLGSATPRRLRALAGLADVLHHRTSRLLIHDAESPVTEESSYFVCGRRRAELLADSRVLINVHRSATPYFEWFRALDAMCNGAVLLTESSEDHEPLEPYRHFVACEPATMAAHLTALLADDDLRTEIARTAYDFLREQWQLVDRLEVVDQVLRDAMPRRSTWFASPLPALPPLQGEPVEVPAAAEGHGIGPMLKKLALDNIALHRRLDELIALTAGETIGLAEEVATPGWHRARPDVSVIIPVYRDAGTVLDAIRSAVGSDGLAVEVIVVEDHSRDETRSVLECYLDENPDAPVLALFRSVNRGLGAARNLGIERARTERCFLLDADNAIRPSALRKLSDALDEDPGASFAYSLIEVWGDEQTLLSHLPWSVGRLVRGPYIDAMAMITRRVWADVGGFLETTESSIYGWEDYAFWLRLAEHGHRGTWLPQPLCRYRRRGGSMISVTNLDPHGPARYLRVAHASLPWPA